jgi:hypothetical protein
MRLAACVGTALWLVIGPSIGGADQPQEGTKPSEAEMKAMMDTYAKLATPSERHKQLETLAGDWKTTTKSWIDPSQPPMESTGSCEQKMILGGRFLKAKCTGDMMGTEFTGIGVTGFDNHTQKYQETWMDSMGTAQYYLEGPAGPDHTVITAYGHYDDPMEGPMKLRSVIRILDNDTHVFEMYGTGKNGKEMKMMEITYTRKK